MPARTWVNFARYVLPAVVYGVVLFVVGSLPEGPQTGLDFRHQDKVLHALGFGVLAVLVWRALAHLWEQARPISWAVASVAVASGLGGLLELWQALLPTRQADVLDFLADAVGAGLAVIILFRSRLREAAPQVATRRPRD